MFFSSYGAARTLDSIRKAGFDTIADEIVATVEPEGQIDFLWVLAQRSRPRRLQRRRRAAPAKGRCG